jgi:hypothetical protein
VGCRCNRHVGVSTAGLESQRLAAEQWQAPDITATARLAVGFDSLLRLQLDFGKIECLIMQNTLEISACGGAVAVGVLEGGFGAFGGVRTAIRRGTQSVRRSRPWSGTEAASEHCRCQNHVPDL